jgi:nicotinamide mononucleotide (NMN) deamidase PncC
MVVSNDSKPKMVAVPSQMLNELQVVSQPTRQPLVLEMSVSLGEDGLPIMQSFVLWHPQE